MKKTQCSDYLSAISAWAGGESPPNLIWDDKWGSAWGRGKRYRFLGHRQQKFCVVWDWKTGEKEVFYLKADDLKGNYTVPAPPEIKNIEDEFNALEDIKSHPYAQKKGIDISQLGFKKLGDRLIVPLYSLLTHEIVSWQSIEPGGHKEFKAGCPLTGGVYCTIGKRTDEIFVCEGMATGWTIHDITKRQVWCAFTKHKLDDLSRYLLKKNPPNSLIMALDNDGKETHKPQIKDKRFKDGISDEIKDKRFNVVVPDNEGDFNDFRDDPLQRIKLVEAAGIKIYSDTKDLDKDSIIKEIKRIKMAYYNYIPIKEQNPLFLDPQQIVADNNALLLCGATGTGKTGFSLGFLKNKLAEDKTCVIWEHSETNRWNRLQAWMAKNEIKNEPIITPSKREVLSYIKPGNIIYIDDTDSFFQIKNPTARREVADTLEDISWVCQLVRCCMILAHYQTKTSRGEANIQLRSGGDMSWINKVRYAAIIETSRQQIEKVNKSGVPVLKTVEQSYLAIQKGYRPKASNNQWWLEEDYQVGKPIKDSTFQKILEKKLKPQVELMVMRLNKMIFEYMVKNKTNQIPEKNFYDNVNSFFGLQKSQAWYYLRLSNYKLDKESKSIIHKETKLGKDEPGPVPF